MRYILAVLFLTFAGVAGADQTPDGKWLYDGKKTIEQESESRERSRIDFGTMTLIGQTEWAVWKGTEVIPLSEFVELGKFCQIFGHKWAIKETHFDPERVRSEYWCVVCHRERKFNKDLMDWEP